MKQKILEWLDRSGFSLEMRAAAAFRRAGFRVRQSAYYHDRAEAKDREIDIIASLKQAGAEGAVHLIVECKSSSKPWVVLVSQDALAEVDRARCSGVLTHEALAACSDLGPSALSELPWYTSADECGYGFRKAFTDGRDDAFAASASACKAAQYFVLGLQADQRQLPAYAAGVPVVVVDSPLFEARLTSEAGIDLHSVTQSAYLFEEHAAFDTWVLVRVVHIDALSDWAAAALRDAERMHRFLTSLPPPERV